jgi:hypothetical protein
MPEVGGHLGAAGNQEDFRYLRPPLEKGGEVFEACPWRIVELGQNQMLFGF